MILYDSICIYSTLVISNVVYSIIPIHSIIFHIQQKQNTFFCAWHHLASLGQSVDFDRMWKCSPWTLPWKHPMCQRPGVASNFSKSLPITQIQSYCVQCIGKLELVNKDCGADMWNVSIGRGLSDGSPLESNQVGNGLNMFEHFQAFPYMSKFYIVL